METKDSKYYLYKPRPAAKNAFRVNTSRSRGQLKLLKEIIKSHHPKWTEVFKQGDVLWSGLAMGYEDIGIGAQILINRLPQMKHICHKKMMGYILNKFVEYWPQQYWFYPRTYLIPEEIDELEQILKKGGMYIAKPSAGSQGDGITIITKIKDIPLTTFNQQYVVQPYIDKPLLLDKKKFDLRLYVLVTSLEPYLCYLNEEGLARFCAEDYQYPTKENLKNPYIHLTNYSLNKNHQDFIPTDTAFGKGSKRCLKVLWQQLQEEGVNVELLRQKINEVARKFMVGLYPFIKYYYNSAFPKSQGKCFQIIGLDILIDKDLTPWILQANANPSLNIDHQVYSSTGETTIQISEIDRYVKRMVIEDALFLTKKSVSSQKEITQGQLYYSYKNIINQQNVEFQEMNIFANMLKIFHYLGGVKTKATITASQFSKLAKFQGMTSDKITKNDYHLVFVKIMRNRFNPGAMDFQGLIQALEYLVNKITPYTEESKYETLRDQVNSIVAEIQE